MLGLRQVQTYGAGAAGVVSHTAAQFVLCDVQDHVWLISTLPDVLQLTGAGVLSCHLPQNINTHAWSQYPTQHRLTNDVHPLAKCIFQSYSNSRRANRGAGAHWRVQLLHCPCRGLWVQGVIGQRDTTSTTAGQQPLGLGCLATTGSI